MAERDPPQQLTDRRASWSTLRLRGKVRVDPFRHEISRVGHCSNAAPFGWVRSKSHLMREVFGGPTETLSLLLGELVHDQLREAARATEA
jgi:hypothetical protein